MPHASPNPPCGSFHPTTKTHCGHAGGQKNQTSLATTLSTTPPSASGGRGKFESHPLFRKNFAISRIIFGSLHHSLKIFRADSFNRQGMESIGMMRPSWVLTTFAGLKSNTATSSRTNASEFSYPTEKRAASYLNPSPSVIMRAISLGVASSPRICGWRVRILGLWRSPATPTNDTRSAKISFCNKILSRYSMGRAGSREGIPKSKETT